MDKKITEHVKFIGVQDKDLRRFDLIFDTEYGTTYNSYLVEGEDKVAIIDTAKDVFSEEYLKNIEAFTSFDKIDYVIINHAEPDHSGSLEILLDKAPNAKVVCSRACSNIINGLLNKDVKPIIVGTGDSIDLGGISLDFYNAPFLHWPETMFTYLKEDKVLFSCDFFGCHYGRELMDYTISDEELQNIQKFYFDAIMSPFKSFAAGALARIDNLDVDVVCTSHGPILKGGFAERKELYKKWATIEEKEKNVVVGYLSCYGYTKSLAESIAKGVEATGVKVNLIDLAEISKEEATNLIYGADGLAVGSATINRDILHPFWEVFGELCTYIVRDKLAVTFGSFGWSGEAPQFMSDRLTQLGFKVIGSFKTKMKPSSDALSEAFILGEKLGDEINNK